IDIETNSIELGIKQMNESEQNGILQTLLSSSDFTTAWNDVDNIATLQDQLRQSIVDLKQAKSTLEDTKASTVLAKNQLTTLESQLSDQQKIVVQNQNAKNKLLAQTKNSEAN